MALELKRREYEREEGKIDLSKIPVPTAYAAALEKCERILDGARRYMLDLGASQKLPENSEIKNLLTQKDYRDLLKNAKITYAAQEA